LRHETHRRQQIEQRRQRGVLDDDAIAGAEMFAEHTLDGVECARGDREVARWNAVGLELRSDKGDERPELERLSVCVPHVSQGIQMGSDLRK